MLQFASGSSLFSCTRRGGMTAGSSAVFVRAWAALHSTSLRGTRLQQLSHPKPVPAASDDTPLCGLASRGASQPRSAPWGTAGHVSHCHSGQRAKANRVSSWKSFTSQCDIKVLKPAAWRIAGELRGGPAGAGSLCLCSHSCLFCSARHSTLIRKSNWSAEPGRVVKTRQELNKQTAEEKA